MAQVPDTRQLQKVSESFPGPKAIHPYIPNPRQELTYNVRMYIYTYLFLYLFMRLY